MLLEFDVTHNTGKAVSVGQQADASVDIFCKCGPHGNTPRIPDPLCHHQKRVTRPEIKTVDCATRLPALGKPTLGDGPA